MSKGSIGERLKALRLKAGLTQEEVGQHVHISKQTLYKYENGIVTNIPSDKIELLAAVYNVTPSYLMGWDDPTEHEIFPPSMLNSLSSAEQSHLEKYRAITDDHKDAIDNQLDYFFTLDTKSKLDSGLSTAGDC